MENERMNFEEYRADWLLKHPASIPVPNPEMSPYPRWARAAALVAFITSALLSGAHMMPAVYDGIKLSPLIDEATRIFISRGSFVAYELGMFMAAFLMAVTATKILARNLTWIIFGTLIIVNLYSVVKVYGFDLQNKLFGTLVSCSFALVPAIAYASGKFYINIAGSESALARKNKEAYILEKQELDNVILADFVKYERNFMKKNTSRNNFMKSGETEIVRENSRSEKKPRKKIHEIAREIHEAGDADLSTDEMMAKYDISLGSTSKVRQILKGGGFTNGRGELLQ